MNSPSHSRAYRIEPKNRFFEANRRIVEYEIRPAYTVSFVTEVDLTSVEAVRRAAEVEGHPKPSYTAFVAKALGLALREFPYANRRVCRRAWLWFLGPRLQCFTGCDIAIAVERQVPGAESVAFVDVLRGAADQSVWEITAWLSDLSRADPTNNRQWRDFSHIITRLPQWLSSRLIRLPYYSPGHWVKYRGGAAIISSPAKYGVDCVLGTWSWPLGLSFGLVRERAVVREGKVVACPTFDLSLNFDRRIMAGAQAAKFFSRVADLLRNAEADLAGGLRPQASSAAPK